MNATLLKASTTPLKHIIPQKTLSRCLADGVGAPSELSEQSLTGVQVPCLHSAQFIVHITVHSQSASTKLEQANISITATRWPLY